MKMDLVNIPSSSVLHHTLVYNVQMKGIQRRSTVKCTNERTGLEVFEVFVNNTNVTCLSFLYKISIDVS